MRATSLPLWARWLLSHLANKRNRLSLIGDLQEEYAVAVVHQSWLLRQQWLFQELVLPFVSFMRTHYLWRSSMFTNYIKTSFRNLKRSPGYTAINILGLAVGMAACMLIFMWVQDEMSYDRFHANRDSLYRIIQKENDGEWTSSTPFSLPRTLKQDFPEIERASRFRNATQFVKVGDKGFYEEVGMADPDFLAMFSFAILSGDGETGLEQEDQIILTRSTARRYFGDRDPVGESVTINGSTQAMVTAVMADPPANSTMDFALLCNFKNIGQQADQSWWTGSQAYVQLAPNTDVRALAQKIKGTTNKYDQRVKNKVVVEDLQPLVRVHLHGLNSTGPVQYVLLFSAIALVVLLIACINFINLTTAQASKRAKEIGLRKAVGASRSSVIRQVYGETMALSLLAFVLALVLVLLTLPGFNQLTGKSFGLMQVVGWPVAPGLLLIALLTGLISGSYPALLLSRFRPIQVLKEGASKGARNPRLRRVLVVVQFTAAIALIISTLIIQRQLQFVQNKDLGFNTKDVVRLDINQALRPQLETFKERLRQHEAIFGVTSANASPNRLYNINPFYWEGRGPDQYETLNFTTVDHAYFETFGLEMAEGRPFSEEFASDSDPKNPGYIINEAAVVHTGLKSPIGKMFSIWNAEGHVVGVVKDFHSRDLHDAIRPAVFLNTTQWSHYFVFVRFQPGRHNEGMKLLKSVWEEMVPDFPCTPRYLDELHRSSYQNDARIGRIFNRFTWLTLFISCLGLLGLAAFLAQERTKEIGIRKTLGASTQTITLLMSKEFVLLLCAANGLAWPLAWWAMSRMMSAWAYRLPLAWWIFAASGLGAILLALMTVSFQSIKAARTNPAKALKYE